MAFSAELAGEEAEEEALPPAGAGAGDGGEVSTEEWRRWGTSSPLPAVAAPIVRELLEMEVEANEKMSFGGVGSKLKVYADDKSKWMSTAQLWTGDSGRDDADSEKEDKERSSSEANSHGRGGFVPFKAVGSGAPAFMPPCFRKYDKAYDVGMPDLSLLSPTPIKSTSAATIGAADESRRQVVGFAQAAARTAAMAPSGPNLNLQTQSQQQQQARKARRCWSPELHRKFVAALQQLGGPQVATPKQIRELMKVDSLTNDEVKSHLQKYCLEGIVV